MPTPPKTVSCLGCIHHFITWQPDTPHGCKTFGFRSKILPSQVVMNQSGEACQLREGRSAQSISAAKQGSARRHG